MAKALSINHVTLVVRDLAEARAFYEQVLGLTPLPTFNLDFPAQFYAINERQQLHITEWDDVYSFRGHVCLQVDDFSSLFATLRARDAVDIAPWGKVRRLPDGAMQLFARDPSGNLLEISCPPETPIDAAIFADALVDPNVGLYVSERNDARGLRGDGATLYHGEQEP